MSSFFKKLLLPFLIIPGFINPVKSQTVDDYYKVIQDQGQPPVEFVQEALSNYPLIIFDDALHNAFEPFEFYRELLENPETNLDFVFLEAFGINAQADIDTFMNAEGEDSTLLLKVFQDSFSGYGWRYQTYYDLMSSIRKINEKRSEDRRIRVISVDQPIYWEGIHTREEYNTFQKSLIGRDHFMYRVILSQMDEFNGQKKGIFLTNTRHAYKGIRNKEGVFYWNTGTFFHQWHKDKSYSIRVHNVTLSRLERKATQENQTTDGLSRFEYSWVKMENGKWDQAFERSGNDPVAFPLKNNPFGESAYIGNHMLDAKEGQTIYDAYDALLFLAPLDQLHFSAKLDFIDTPSFKEELKRRITILEDGNIEAFLSRNEVQSIDEYIEQKLGYVPVTKNTLLQN